MFNGYLPQFRYLRPLFPVLALFFFSLTFGCSGSGSGTPPTCGGACPAQPVAPSNLVYPQTSVSAVVGQAIANDTPTVTGTAPSYSINPALPAGLTLSSSTGVISGTPTAAAPATTYTVTASNSAGSTTATVQITVKALSLSYSPSTITATVGQAIAAATPTVNGNISSYTVAPALPSGLTLNSTTGIISGTPTTVAAQATYVVTASNASGSTTASLQITVNPAAPSSLAYPQTTINAAVGKTIAPDFPSFAGSVTSFSVSPGLPAGLKFDPSSGAIFGTPTAITPQATYTVTVSNAGGSATTSVSIVVNKGYTTVLELGHGAGVGMMRSITGRLLSLDQSGHWALWDTNADTELASGDQYLSSGQAPWPVDIAGSLAVISHQNGLEIRSSVDGHLISFIVAPNTINPMVASKGAWWKLASDGSYICAGSSTGLAAFLPAAPLLFRQGDYSTANAFAAPGQIQVALGPAGQNVIETIAVSGGASTVGPAFSGSFNSWFVDGQRFLTNTGTSVWEYSASSVQQGLVSLPTIQNLTGIGNWIYAFDPHTTPYTVSIYAVGANSPSASYTVGVSTSVIPSGPTLAILASESGSGSVVDLSGSSPVKTDFTTLISYLSAYTATSASKWFAANQHGVIVDGSSTNAAQTLDLGQEWSIAGGTTRVAIATANGLITTLNPATPSATSTIAFSSSKLALSSDDTVLAAAANSRDAQYEPDRTLKVFSLPSATTTASFPYSLGTGSTTLFDFSLSGSGTALGQVTGVYNGSTWSYSRTVGPVTGGPATWSDTPAWDPIQLSRPAIQLSPDGTLIAASSGAATVNTTTNIYKNGVLVTAVPGWVVGWLDNSRLLVNTYAQGQSSVAYSGAVIYDSTGAKVSTSTIPELLRIQALGGDQIYSPDKNTIFSLSSGQSVWTATVPSNDGAVAGSNVVFASGSQVLLDTH
jgi:hypothetical protein